MQYFVCLEDKNIHQEDISSIQVSSAELFNW